MYYSDNEQSKCVMINGNIRRTDILVCLKYRTRMSDHPNRGVDIYVKKT